MNIYAIHAPFAEKLANVMAEMETLGAPTLRVVDCGDHFMALEGSHRLAAAHALGLEPTLIVFDQDDDLDLTDYDWFDAAHWGETRCAAGEIAGELFCPRQARAYDF